MWVTPYARRPWAVLFVMVGTVALLIAALNFVWLDAINPWILVTAPLSSPHRPNSILGYSWLLEGSPIHKENISPLLQSLTFNGVLGYPDGYYLRPLYPFLISLASWHFGLFKTGLAANYVSYALLVVATGWLAFAIRPERWVALAGAALAATGCGSIIHLNDISAHLLAYATYALIVCFIHESGVWHARQPLAVHLQIAAALAIASLAYP